MTKLINCKLCEKPITDDPQIENIHNDCWNLKDERKLPDCMCVGMTKAICENWLRYDPESDGLYFYNGEYDAYGSHRFIVCPFCEQPINLKPSMIYQRRHEITV